VWALLVGLLLAVPQGPAARSAIVAGIQIQGNTATSDEEVRRLGDVRVGMPFADALIEHVAARLRAAKRFERVEVLKRYASIADPSQIMLVIVVDEGPVKIVMTGDPEHPTKVVRRRFPNLLILPILRREDEYGITYGARLTAPEPRLFGKNSRITYPLSWGGTRQAAVDVEKRFDNAAIDRLTFGGGVSRRRNPAFDADDDRARVFARVEREVVHRVRVGADGGWERASFEGTADLFTHARTDIIVDTRIDPILARNAVYGRASIEHLQFADRAAAAPIEPDRYGGYSGGVNRTELDGRGYLGFIGQTVLAGRVLRLDSDRPLPEYMQPQIGGLGTLRGFPGGYAVGDTLVTMSGELVVPLTSPLKFAKFGVTAFVDRGTVYAKGERFVDQDLLEGYGGGVWLAAAFFRLNIAVAHGVGAPNAVRVHVGGNVTF
jgi:hypothetical protein